MSEYKPLLDAAAYAASALTDGRTEDDPSWQTVQEKVENAEKRYGDLETACGERKEELEATLAKSKAFHDGCDDLLGWLVVKADQVEGLSPVEAKPDAIKEQIEELKVSA